MLATVLSDVAEDGEVWSKLSVSDAEAVRAKGKGKKRKKSKKRRMASEDL